MLSYFSRLICYQPADISLSPMKFFTLKLSDKYEEMGVGWGGKLWSLLLPSHLQKPENGVLVEVSHGWIISFIACFFLRCCPLIPDGSHAKPEVNCILNNCLVQVLHNREKMTPHNGNGIFAIPNNFQWSLSFPPHLGTVWTDGKVLWKTGMAGWTGEQNAVDVRQDWELDTPSFRIWAFPKWARQPGVSYLIFLSLIFLTCKAGGRLIYNCTHMARLLLNGTKMVGVGAGFVLLKSVYVGGLF